MPEMRRPRFPLPGASPATERYDWHDDAACRTHPAHWWDDSLDGRRETREQRQQRHAQAAEVCGRCPVAAQCEADYDRERDEGVRFGRVLPPLGPPSRVARVGSGDKGGRPRLPVEHGTENGYRAHLRRGDRLHPLDPCGCLSANRRAQAARRAARTVCELCGRDMSRGHLSQHMRRQHGAEKAS